MTLLLALACTPRSTVPVVEPVMSEVDGVRELTGTLRVDAEPGARRFQGVWLEAVDGSARWLLAYRLEPWAVGMDGASLRVVGRTWTPDPSEQHVQAEHLRLVSAHTSDRLAPTPWVELGESTTWQGRFRDTVWEQGTKLEGEHQLLFVASEGSWPVWGGLPEGAALDVDGALTGRLATPSPVNAGPGGPAVIVEGWSAR